MTKELKLIEQEGNRVLTTSQLAESYGTDKQLIINNFNRNKDRYKEGKHFIALENQVKNDFINQHQIDLGSKKAKTLYLWTEKGAWLHAKSLNTDEAWDAYEILVDEYYRIINNYKPLLPTTYKEALQSLLIEVEKNEKLELENKELNKEIEYKEDIIINLVDEVSLSEKRQILNRVVRMGGGNKVRDRWTELYKQFEGKYHINVKKRLDNYNEENKPKLRNKLDYIDKVMNKIPELYEIAVKLYENDIEKLVQEMYELQK